MLKYEMQKEGLEIEVKTILTDFELAIQMAAQSAFPWVELRGCRFHYILGGGTSQSSLPYPSHRRGAQCSRNYSDTGSDWSTGATTANAYLPNSAWAHWTSPEAVRSRFYSNCSSTHYAQHNCLPFSPKAFHDLSVNFSQNEVCQKVMKFPRVTLLVPIT